MPAPFSFSRRNPLLLPEEKASSFALPAYAENTADEAGFPNEIFRNYVSESFDSDKDGSLSEQEILYISEVDMISSSVSSLKGIEFFTELRKYNYIKSTPEVTAENVLNREFYADAPNEKRLTDVTEFKYYVGVEVKKIYLRAILDIFDR